MLEVRGLSKRFGGVCAAEGVDLSVAAGEIVALLGPNGAGKTTTFAMVAGFVRPDSGSVVFDGRDISGWAAERVARAGLVRTFQITQPFAGLSVAENIRVGAFLRTSGTGLADAKAREVGRRLGLAAYLDRPAADLTVAGRKRLEVARAVATEPHMLLLDEVMAGLNPTELKDIVDLVRQLNTAGLTILLIEHVMHAVAALAGRTYVLAQGAVIAEGTPAQIANDPAVIEAYLGHGAAERMRNA